MAAAYRVTQFVRAAVAYLQPVPADRVRSYLPTPALELYSSMPRYEQHHALRVLQTLEEQGHTDPDLMAAALLHDVGKTAGGDGAVRLWHRVAVVLLQAFWPGLLLKLGGEQGEGWRRSFYVQLHHASMSAELAREAGCSPTTVALIRDHEVAPGQVNEPLLRDLQAADNAN